MILSAGIIIVRQLEGKWFYLFLRAYNFWDFPKGEVEIGETPSQPLYGRFGKRPTRIPRA